MVQDVVRAHERGACPYGTYEYSKFKNEKGYSFELLTLHAVQLHDCFTLVVWVYYIDRISNNS